MHSFPQIPNQSINPSSQPNPIQPAHLCVVQLKKGNPQSASHVKRAALACVCFMGGYSPGPHCAGHTKPEGMARPAPSHVAKEPGHTLSSSSIVAGACRHGAPPSATATAKTAFLLALNEIKKQASGWWCFQEYALSGFTTTLSIY